MTLESLSMTNEFIRSNLSNILYQKQSDNSTTIVDRITTTTSPILTTDVTTNFPIKANTTNKFPYPILIILFIWIILVVSYSFVKWKQKDKIQYIIPRVFVLCSPRTVQFHYELILRIGLPSYDFNPEKHDIDITILGQQKNEVVPMTRLNTKTLLDEPLITSLSIVVYRLVELPAIKYLLLKHSGPFRSWVFAYDFTIIDLTTNREQYFTLNQFIGALDRLMTLENPTPGNVHYPIDDVPLPKWSTEDIFIYLFTVTNSIMFSISMMPINCNYIFDLLSIFASSFGAVSLVFFLEWLLYYHNRWNQDRKEYFNDYQSFIWFSYDNSIKIIISTFGLIIGGITIYKSISILDHNEAIIWLLSVINSSTIVLGLWNAFKQADIGESIVNLGLKLRGIETIGIGMKQSEMIGSVKSKTGSTSDDGTSGSSIIAGAGLSGGTKMSSGVSSRVAMNIGPRSSVKSFGFDNAQSHINKQILSNISSIITTPSNNFRTTGSVFRRAQDANKKQASPINFNSISDKIVMPNNNEPKTTSPAPTVVKKTSRHVKFAEPVAQQHNYEKAATGKSVIDDKKGLQPTNSSSLKSIKSEGTKKESKLKDLQAPYTLIAHLDIAAQKMHLREKPKDKGK